MNQRLLPIIVLIVSVFGGVKSEQKQPAGEKQQNSNAEANKKELETYQRLFLQKRSQHVQAVEEMIGSYDYKKQYEMVDLIRNRVSQVFAEARQHLMQSDFEPGMALPSDEATRSMISVVLENVAFVGDIVLRLPDVSHKVFDKNKEFMDELRWGMDFAERTEFLDDIHKQLFNLVAQELQFIPKDPSYHNPYKRKDVKMEENKTESKKKKKKEKAKKKGPRMTKVEL